MIPTVADVLALPVVQAGAPEVVSAERLDRLVRWVHVSDVSDLSDLLQGGELVLTTGPALLAEPHEYLDRLVRAGASGLVVELGAAIPELPPSAGSTARSLGLPLVALHRKTRFVAITEAVHRLIVADQYEELAFAHRAHETFTDLSMRRASLSDIVNAAAAMIGETVVLEDLSHQVLAASPQGETAAEALRDWQQRSRMTADDRTAQEPWTVSPVGPRGEDWGRLIIPRAPRTPAKAKMVLERAAQALALHRMAERGRSGLEHQAQTGLIEDVLQGRITDDREAEARAHALGLQAASTYLPATVRISATDERLDPVASQRRTVRLLDAVVHCVKSAGHSALCSIRRDGEIGLVLALAARRGVTHDAAVTRLGVALRDSIRRGADADRVVFALGSGAATVVDAIHGLRDAAHVADVALAMPETERVYYRAADVRLRGLLALLHDDPRVQNFAETELKALLLHDAHHGDTSVSVLRGYLALAGNKSALAKRLHMSRPALYSRLDAIERILGVDLADGESMTSLHVALLILDAHDAAPHAR
ncbi:MAG: PucR family transcriptional regulator [Actinobacteria bacterium]|nr:PucR family transcriptional regulator [Actinomycetota bacterium]